ncbi:hypothetical protein ACFVUR_19270 [Stenotrophomonas bentonitica]|uniref:hypothetical protein n=1 Tax=Stenotrophomonas bentonitica TaxID=1450134 RepID=UPI0036F02C9F
MAEGSGYITIDAGTPITGGWCEHCGLPSVATIPATTMDSDGVRLVGYATVCVEHELMEVDDDDTR